MRRALMCPAARESRHSATLISGGEAERRPHMMPVLTEISGRQKAIILGSVMLGLFVSAMDQTVVSTATPRVVAELGGLNLYSWLFTSYMLTSTTLVPIVGKLGDIYGRKPFFM